MHQNRKRYVNPPIEVKEAAVQSTELLLCEVIPEVTMKDVMQQILLLTVARDRNGVSNFTGQVREGFRDTKMTQLLSSGGSWFGVGEK